MLIVAMGIDVVVVHAASVVVVPFMLLSLESPKCASSTSKRKVVSCVSQK